MKSLILLLAVAFMLTTGFAEDKDTRIFELRTYHATPGKLDALNARFRDHTMQLFQTHGMANLGYWVPMDNTNNLLIYLLSFPSLEAHDKAWKDFMTDPDWIKVKTNSEANGPLVGKVDSVLLRATDFSPATTITRGLDARVFELRTYHTNPGKLNDLLARFRDHTAALFDKHNLSQFGYWLPTKQKDGADNTLIYILVHKSRESALENFKEFAADPAWVKAKTDSEVNGPLTVKDGVTRVFMTPTDYSPTK